MRAAVYDRYGGPDEIAIREVATPDPKPGEVLVRVHAAARNPSGTGTCSSASAA